MRFYQESRNPHPKSNSPSIGHCWHYPAYTPLTSISWFFFSIKSFIFRSAETFSTFILPSLARCHFDLIIVKYSDGRQSGCVRLDGSIFEGRKFSMKYLLLLISILFQHFNNSTHMTYYYCIIPFFVVQEVESRVVQHSQFIGVPQKRSSFKVSKMKQNV